MKKIFLCCSAGMSTSMLVKKMEQAAADRGLEVEIAAIAMSGFDEAIEAYDVCLLGPQVKFKLADFQAQAAELNKKVEAIDPMSYGMMNGEKVLDQALSLLEA
ncbi:PTS sugar transporter subunit IIB [Endozoicomonas ascidiicola]|uniref:PTS sugar transporter subunit IIB n=1 Tax=Endozoicomonas ascidiicola TaxID=1698521 RepID=UPI00082C1332|nr:PTS sugar transporter subunit IIB [Endozoicomonas ascidiicola]